MTSPCVLKLRPESCFVWTQWPWHQFIRDVRARCNEIPSRRSWGNMVMGTAGTDDGRTTRNHTTAGHDYHQRGGINVIDIAVSHFNDMWVNQYTSKTFSSGWKMVFIISDSAAWYIEIIELIEFDWSSWFFHLFPTCPESPLVCLSLVLVLFHSSKLVLLSVSCLSSNGNGGFKAYFIVVDVSISPFIHDKVRQKSQVYPDVQGYDVCSEHSRLQGQGIAWQRQIGADSCAITASQYESEGKVQYLHFDSILSVIFVVLLCLFSTGLISPEKKNSINVDLLFSFPSEW